MLWAWTLKVFKTSGNSRYLIKRPSGWQYVNMIILYTTFGQLDELQKPCYRRHLTQELFINKLKNGFLILWILICVQLQLVSSVGYECSFFINFLKWCSCQPFVHTNCWNIVFYWQLCVSCTSDMHELHCGHPSCLYLRSQICTKNKYNVMG